VQREELAQVRHEERAGVDHRARVAVLIAVAVDLEPQVQVLRVGHLVARDEERADGTERVAALALVPLAEALELVLALGEVVDDAKTRDVLERALWAHVLRRAADHEAELDFPVALARATRDHDVVVGADDRARRLHEHHRLRGHLRAGFRGVVGVVEADADELARSGDTRAEARTFGN
jgi:hypothetical protein